MTDFSPREIVSELDRFIVGQSDAKRAVSIALRNRWRRLQLTADLREEVLPKNILMIGPTGVGKTEIARRLAKLAGAPFIKVEATKFTEVGYVGRDVEQIVRDLVEVAISQVRERKRKDVQARAQLAAEERVLDALVGANASPATRNSFRKKLRAGELNDKEIEIETQSSGSGMPMFEIPGMPGAQMGAISIGDIFGKIGGKQQDAAADGRATRTRSSSPKNPTSCSTPTSWCRKRSTRSRTTASCSSTRSTRSASARTARRRRLARGRAARPAAADRGHHGLDQARRGQDRPHPVHRVRRVPHRKAVGPAAGTAGPPADPRRAAAADPRRYAPHPDRAGGLADQAICRAAADRRRRRSTSPTVAIDALADVAVAVNSTVENIGARRLQTVMERVLDEISFAAPDRHGETIRVDADYVQKHVGDLAKNADLSRFIL